MFFSTSFNTLKKKNNKFLKSINKDKEESLVFLIDIYSFKNLKSKHKNYFYPEQDK